MNIQNQKYCFVQTTLYSAYREEEEEEEFVSKRPFNMIVSERL